MSINPIGFAVKARQSALSSPGTLVDTLFATKEFEITVSEGLMTIMVDIINAPNRESQILSEGGARGNRTHIKMVNPRGNTASRE